MLSIIKLRLLRLKDDFWVIILMMVMAFGLTAIFSVSFNEYRPSVLIVDNDRSSYSETFIKELQTSKSFRFTESTRDEAVKAVEEGKVLCALIINNRFDQEIENGERISIEMMKLKDDMLILTLQEQVSGIAVKMAGGVRVADITSEFIAAQKPGADKTMEKETAYQNVMEAWTYKNPLMVTAVTAQSGSESSYDSQKHSMIGFSLFFSMFTMVFGIGTILYDRQHRTWQRMLISPVSKSAILGGSIIVTFFVGLLQLAILVLAGQFLLGIDWGNSLGGILLVVAAFVFAVISMGLMLSGIVKTQAQLSSLTPILLTSTSMLGGCMWPLEIVNNKILLFLAELTPQKWAIQGMEDIATRGLGFEAAVLPSLVLIGMGILFFSTGVRLVKSA